jgi:hypothetical protein
MKNKLIMYLLLLIVCILGINSCGYMDDEKNYNYRLITFGTDGSELYAYHVKYNDLNCDHGVIEPMHNSRRFAVCNENLFIFDVDTHEIESYLEDIDIDEEYDHNGPTGFGISYDDRYIAFTSGYQVYCFDMITNEFTQITTGFSDEFPTFGIDNRIYFSRLNSENNSYKLMSIEIDGSELQELCEHDEYITKIFPGHADPNIVYFLSKWRNFQKTLLDSGEKITLYEFTSDYYLISKSNDDQYFNFSSDSNTQYIFDTQTNAMQTYLYPELTEKRISVILPDEKIAFISKKDYEVYGMLWDIDSNYRIGEEFLVRNTTETGSQFMAISSDGTVIALFHKI